MARSATEREVAPELIRFAERLQADWQAQHVLAFGPRALGVHSVAHPDYDFIVVSPRFAGEDTFLRGRGIREVFWAVGLNEPMTLYCLTPEEFKVAVAQPSFIAEAAEEAIDLLSADRRGG